MKFIATISCRAVALSAVCCLGMLRPAAAGLIYEDLAVISAANVDAMALNADTSESPANETDGSAIPGLPGGSATQRQMQIGSASLSLPGADAPHFKRRGSNMGRGGGTGNGSGGGGNGLANGSGNSLAGGSGLGASAASGLSSGLGSSSAGFGAPTAGPSLAGTSSSQNAGGSPAAGTDASNPLLPSSTNGSTYSFNASVGAGTGGGSTALFADPPLASGFIFTTNPGSPDFASVAVTTPLPHTPSLSITFDGQTDQLAPGSTFTFPSGGVSTFHVFGISPTDVATGNDFTTKLTFTGPGNVSFTETANPEPGSLALMAIGACGLWGARRRKRKV